MHTEDNIYDIALHHIGKYDNDIFICIIGAMDGVSFDETRGYISLYGWNGLFVEPILEQFNKLKKLYDNTPSICENVAVSDYDGVIRMITIDQKAIDEGKIHECFGGMSAVFPPKNGLASSGDRQTVNKYGRLIEVPCLTPESLFTKHNIKNFDVLSIDAEGHDYVILKNIDIKKYNPRVIRIEYINLSEEEKKEVIGLLEKNNYIYTISGQNLDAVRTDYWEKIKSVQKIITSPKLTLVTGIWDLKRNELTEEWRRDFTHYLCKFEELLQNLTDIPLIVFIDPDNEHIVWKYRSKHNTVVYHQTKEDFNSSFFPFFDQVQNIRTNPSWYDQVGWLKNSAQAEMEWYNPMVMSKMFMLHNAKCFNPFNTEYMFWIDGGITNTVHPGYFSHDKVLEKIPHIINNMLFLCFPYNTNTEVHGFQIEEMNQICGENLTRVARGGFFGGHIDDISKANDTYYHLLNDTLSRGFMGTEESIFTIMTYIDPDTYQYSMINADGLISTFFENLKNNNVQLNKIDKKNNRKKHKNNDIVVYINTFNSPEQLQMVLDSFEEFDKDFIKKTGLVLINNSTNTTTTDRYNSIVNKYSFIEHIRNGNMGVCGARQWAAEHFDNLGSEYMVFFEDDMLLDFNGYCSFGLRKNINNLLSTVIKIMKNETYDFLKFSFSEFYGHNGEQWSWHNVPEEKRISYFGKVSKRPLTKFDKIKSINNIPYVEGEIYYSNWPHIIDQEGNQKCFLDTKWANPFEQTWMSHMYTLTVENKIHPAILLASPITHNRVHHYGKDERKEN
jgi:FkbM family methyltransferase